MEEIIFNEEKHQYTLIKENGEKTELVSVTQLLKKHGILPDYSGVDEQVLHAKAQRGRVVHEELENYVKTGEIGFTAELEQFITQCTLWQLQPQYSEFIVHNDEIAGTVDVAGVVGENELPFIADYKTTTTLHKHAVAWQLSLYAYLDTEHIYEKFFAIHFPDADTCKIVEIQPISREKIEKLLECERNCELYKEETLELSFQDSEKVVAIQTELKRLDNQKKELERQENELKEYLISKMQETGVGLIDNDLFRITYIAPYPKETLDTTRLKKELPDIANKYTKRTLAKPSVRITLK